VPSLLTRADEEVKTDTKIEEMIKTEKTSPFSKVFISRKDIISSDESVQMPISELSECEGKKRFARFCGIANPDCI